MTDCTWETRYAQWVDLVVRCVAELPDRTSPEDGSALGLLICDQPAPESVVNQVLVASERAAQS